MNQEIKTKWVAALRSGEYKQTKSVLTNGKGFCCLGVLCKVSQQEGGIGIEQNLLDTGGDENIGLIIRAWAELPGDFGDSVTINGVTDPLTCHNDGGRTFLEIADAIEEQL